MSRVFAGRRLSVDLEEHDGHTFELVRTQQAAAVVAITEADQIILVEQFRPAVGITVIEIPAGLLDQTDADPAATAARELLEETGFAAVGNLTPLGEGFFSTVGLSDERFWLYLARTQAQPVGKPDGEASRVLLVPRGEAFANARSGRYQDSKTCLAFLLAAQALL